MQYSHYGVVLCAALAASHGGAQEAAAPVAAPAAGKAVAKQAAKKSPLPARKSGLWEVTLRSEDAGSPRQGPGVQRVQTVLQCTSAEAEPVMLLSIVPGQEDCHEVTSTRSTQGGGRDIRTVCYPHDHRVELQMELAGDLQSTYHGTYSVTYAQTPQRNMGRMMFTGRWLGACKPGQRPGDMVLPNGATVNVVDDRRRAESQGHEGHKH